MMGNPAAENSPPARAKPETKSEKALFSGQRNSRRRNDG